MIKYQNIRYNMCIYFWKGRLYTNIAMFLCTIKEKYEEEEEKCYPIVWEFEKYILIYEDIFFSFLVLSPVLLCVVRLIKTCCSLSQFILDTPLQCSRVWI